jgi:predicted RNase H-like HicB family nuclease
MQRSFQARVWIIIERAEDIPGEWVAHCLDFDVVAQGRDPHQAFDMASESIGMIVFDDLERGANPRERRAPEQYWQRLSHIVDNAEKRPPNSPLPGSNAAPGVYVVEVVFFARSDGPNKVFGMAPAQKPEVEMAYALPAQPAA